MAKSKADIRNGIAVITPGTMKFMMDEEALLVRELFDTCTRESAKHYVIDMTGVEWVNSHGLGILISMAIDARDRGSCFVFCNLSDKVRSLMVITKLDTIFPSYDSVELAVAQCT